MADYDSVEALFAAGTANMECLINNTAYDDNTYTAAGADWLIFNGVKAESIFVSGNTWFGIGTNAEHLKVNRRDTKMWYLYREEGTLYRFYRFLKFRWRGYSQYNSTTEACLLEYDVVLWENGCISLHMVRVPTNNYNGVFSLTAASAVTYTPPTAALPDVTFTPEDDDHTAFSVAYERIALQMPFDRRYLVDAQGKLYALDDAGVLAQLEETELTPSVFREHGMEDLPDGALLLPLVDAKVYCWQDSMDYELPELTATVSGWQSPQVIVTPDYDMTHESILGVETVRIVCSEDCLFAISFDEGNTWYAHNGISWAVVSEPYAGMTADAFSNISVDDWALVATTGKFRIRCVLFEDAGYLESLVVDYLN